MALQPDRYKPSKAPFNYQSMDDFRFQTNDVATTRVIKLEYLRKRLLSIEEQPEPEPFPEFPQDRYRFGAFFTFAIRARETLLAHTLADDIMLFKDFQGCIGSVGVVPEFPVVCRVLLDPQFQGETVRPNTGTVLGWMTIMPTGQYLWETVDHKPCRIYRGSEIVVQAPELGYGAAAGSFTLRALLGFPKIAILLEGDMQETDPADDVLLLEGDQQSGIARVLMSGDALGDIDEEHEI